MKNEYKVTTKYNKDLILQETSFPGQDNIRDITTSIIKLQENGVREALIKLGWTPPESLSDIRSEAVGRFIDAFRYEFEGPRDTDSIESFADQYIANRIKEGVK